MKKIILFLAIVALISTSCQKHLDRDNALNQIKQHDGNTYFPQKHTYEIVKGFIKDMHTEGRGVTALIGEDEFKSQQQNIEQYARLGLLTLEETPHREETTQFLLGTTVRTWISVKVLLTLEGRKYLDSEKENSFLVKIWDTSIKQITGIKEMKELHSAQVEYTISNTNITPFGSVFSDRNNEQIRTASFSLYDDGWRIQN